MSCALMQWASADLTVLLKRLFIPTFFPTVAVMSQPASRHLQSFSLQIKCYYQTYVDLDLGEQNQAKSITEKCFYVKRNIKRHLALKWCLVIQMQTQIKPLHFPLENLKLYMN